VVEMRRWWARRAFAHPTELCAGSMMLAIASVSLNNGKLNQKLYLLTRGQI
jgi:hypothetical protein